MSLLRRIFSCLILFALMLGKLHPCQDTFVRADGSRCADCVALEAVCKASHEESSASIAASHGDCHDCCEAVACNDKHQSQPAVYKALAISFDLFISEEIRIELPIEPAVRQRVSFAEASPIHGPPDRVVARGPPTSSTV